ncbi:orotidine-5'-phosphate decarboxylase [Gardnerella swidsinskii]|uniref:orotidine-5'-phosphate decarboxylase n=1 Tax=Gardnerella TaxID=2701 RepID=UPI0001D85868|nr:orotidine-5'-phosphate decarboxylase [Gardnerella swidsinskii]EFH71918.1 orotidine 5'-phosphate decarboxylase [Gardnerella vaginalis 5-1]RFT35886.1 orotidine-5'-phosphate decarboxylase [Bifidobacteriaceae bacterium NR020]RIY25932.1 orotidine-5'-phosphate decarboxylase [Bifidobacteriaceae bacterium WP021]UQA88817.1 orotidine-5'-phosphate decarboxylase [Gardnerella swidsinskii]
MDELIEAIAAKQNPSVVGLDPKPGIVPAEIISSLADEVLQEVEGEDALPTLLATAYFEFNRAIIDAVADFVPAVKPQIAMYEALGSAGMDTYAMTCEYAKSQGLVVIGDAKRGDIGSTAGQYAAHLSGFANLSSYFEDENATGNALPQSLKNLLKSSKNLDVWHEDSLTVNPYMGSDGVKPFIDEAVAHDKSIFVLLRTSNPSSKELQELILQDGKPVYEHMADLIENWGASGIGKHGYSRVGAVVGATHPQEGKHLREIMPHTFFLVPGYGAQGGTAQDVAGMFDANSEGAIVNSSRGIIGAWKKSEDYAKNQGHMSLDDILDIVRDSATVAAKNMRDDLRNAVYR